MATTGFDLATWFNKLLGIQTAPASATKAKPRENAVLVAGATGKTGRAVVKTLLAAGRTVVAAARSEEKARETLLSAGGSETESGGGSNNLPENLFIVPNVDVSRPETLSAELFRGVTQVVSCLGPVFVQPPATSELTSEAVDFRGNLALLRAAEAAGLADAPETSEKLRPLVKFSEGAAARAFVTPKEGSSGGGEQGSFNRLDDVIMGGVSSSDWEAAKTDSSGVAFGTWGGDLIVEGGGFCGTVTSAVEFDCSGFDGIFLRVRNGAGGPKRFKFRLKPADLTANEYQYQAPFDTADTGSEFPEIRLPFEDFVAVRRNDVVYSAPKVNKSPSKGKMASMGLVYSRFEFNEFPNPRCKPGRFSLDVAEIGLYKAARPNFLLVSSAASERFNRFGSLEERFADIPIAQLNPGGILNWKYKAETAMRLSPMRHVVLRATGLLPEGASGGPRPLQAYQGDTVSGRVTRSEVAAMVSAAMDSPFAAGKSLELRRDETEGARGGLSDQELQAVLRPLILDQDRALHGLPPFPAAKEPPPPVTEEEKARVLADPRVQAQQARDRGAPGGGA